MPAFIMIGTNRTGRIDPGITPANVVGLGTYGLRTCVAVIIIGTSSQRISLTHHAGGLERDYSSILDEIKWVGSPYTVCLAKNTQGMREGLLEIKDNLGAQSQDPEKYLATYDTEGLIMRFLRTNKLKISRRLDTEGQILVQRDGNFFRQSPQNTELQSDKLRLREAIASMNDIYSKVILHPKLEFDGKQFLAPELVQPALYMLNLIAFQLDVMKCERSLENVYLALAKVDAVLKSLGIANGAMLAVYGEPSARRDALLTEIRDILSGPHMQKIIIPPRIAALMQPAVEEKTLGAPASLEL